MKTFAAALGAVFLLSACDPAAVLDGRESLSARIDRIEARNAELNAEACETLALQAVVSDLGADEIKAARERLGCPE